MRILSLKDLEAYPYDSSWIFNLELSNRKGSEMAVVYAEYDKLVLSLEPGENFSKAIHNLQILERDDGKYQIIFAHEFLPESTQKWHEGDYIFKGLITDFMPLQS